MSKPVNRKLQKYFNYLCVLRNHGMKDIYGAVPFLLKSFPKLSCSDATSIVRLWRKQVDKDFVNVNSDMREIEVSVNIIEN